MIKILVFGSNGMVGTSILNSFSKENKFQIIPSTRKDTNLFKLDEIYLTNLFKNKLIT